MKTKNQAHTPGPWTVSSAGKFLAIRKAEGMPVLLATMTEHLPINGINQDANAALVAASPELLVGCKGLVQYLKDHAVQGRPGAEAFETALAAIAKAEGRA